MLLSYCLKSTVLKGAPATTPLSGHAVHPESLNEQDNTHGYSDPFGELPGSRR